MRMYQGMVGALALALALVAFCVPASAAETLRIATDIPYVPMEYEAPDGTLTGFDVDLGNAICAHAGFECSWSDQEWNGMIPGLMARKYDAIISSMTVTPRRAEKVLFSKPYVFIPNGFYAPADGDLNEISEAALTGKKIGVQRGTIQDDYVTDTYGKVAEIVRYQDGGDLVVDMEVGRLDATFLTQIVAQTTLMDAHPGKYRQVGDDLTEPRKYFGEGIAVALRPGDTDIAEKINASIDVLQADGTYHEIYRKYFNKDPSFLD